MTDWKRSVLREVVLDWIKGATPKRSEEEYFSEQDGIPWVRVSDLNDTVIMDSTQHLSLEGKKQIGRTVPKNAVLLSVSGTIGKTAIAGVELTVNQAVQAMVFDEEQVLPEYACYYLQFIREQLEKTANTVTIPNLTKAQLEDTAIFYPEINEQRRIMELLKKAQDIAEQQKRTGLKVNLILYQAMQEKWTAVWKKLPRICLKEAVTEPILAGGAAIREETAGGDRYLLKAGDLLLRRYRVDEGEPVLLAEEETSENAWGAGMFRVRVKTEKIRPEFLLLWLSYSFQYLDNAPYSDKNLLDTGTAGAIQIPLVPVREQDKFVRAVRRVLLMQRKIQNMEQTAQAYYRSMLAYAFSARLTEAYRRENGLDDPDRFFFRDMYQIRYVEEEKRNAEEESWQQFLSAGQQELMEYLSEFQREILRIYGESAEALPIHVALKRLRKENRGRFRSQSIQDAIAAVRILSGLGFLTGAVPEKIMIEDTEIAGADNRPLTIRRYEFVRG